MKLWLIQFALVVMLAATPTLAEELPIDVMNKKVCLNSKRVSAEFPKWEQFGNGCVDYCGEHEACTEALQNGCDCGPKHCWDQTTNQCVENK